MLRFQKKHNNVLDIGLSSTDVNESENKTTKQNKTTTVPKGKALSSLAAPMDIINQWSQNLRSLNKRF